jgi:hypothetical protein
MKMVRAMAVSMERVVSFLVFMVFTAFQMYRIADFSQKVK